MRLENASRLCAVAVTVITIIPRPGPAYQVAFHRFVEVSYGVHRARGLGAAAPSPKWLKWLMSPKRSRRRR
jgi:hypothetical protein